MMTPDKDRCLGNIYTLAKKKGIKIGDLETSCDVSIGYLARLRQDKKQALPGSEFLFHAAVLLGTTVDKLLNFDYRLAVDTEIYLSTFISRLTQDTVTGKLSWRADTACYPSAFVTDRPVPAPAHPLLALDPVLSQQGKSKEIYLSPFHPAARDLVPKAAWRAALSGDSDVLLVRLMKEQDSEAGAGDPWEELELYLCGCNNNILSALCHTNWQNPGVLDSGLIDLYETVSMMFQQCSLDQYAVSTIDRYMDSRSGQ